MVKVSACASLADLKSLRSEWSALLQGADNASVFTGWEWTDAAWRYAPAGKQPLVLIARESSGGRLVGVLPLARTSRIRFMRALEVLGCGPSGYPYGDYGGLVAERGQEGAVWAAMLSYLKESKWGMIDLRNCMMGISGYEAQLYSRLPENTRWGLRVQEADVCRRIALPETFDGYLATLSSNGRQNLRRKLRKLEAGGHKIEAVDAADEEARNEALEAVFKYHQARWTRDPSGGAFPDERTRDMHRYLAAHMAGGGFLDLRVVRASGGDIAGVIYNFRYNGVGYYYQLGFRQDSEWAPYSLGVCLLADSIKAAVEAGCHTFDLLRGDHDYKRHFGGSVASNLRVTVYRYGWLPAAEGAARKLRRKLVKPQAAHVEQAAV